MTEIDSKIEALSRLFAARLSQITSTAIARERNHVAVVVMAVILSVVLLSMGSVLVSITAARNAAAAQSAQSVLETRQKMAAESISALEDANKRLEEQGKAQIVLPAPNSDQQAIAAVAAALVLAEIPTAKDGINGRMGPIGPAGMDGPPGVQGIPGADGKNGVDGQDGEDGQDGTDATGVAGPPGSSITGPPGAPGPSGAPGSSITGPAGVPGPAGTGVQSVDCTADGLIVVYTDGQTQNAGVCRPAPVTVTATVPAPASRPTS